MRSFLLLCLCLTMAVAVIAQKPQEDPEYTRLIRQAEDFAKVHEWQKAINKYKSAKSVDPTKTTEVDQKIDALQKQKWMEEIGPHGPVSEAVKSNKEVVKTDSNAFAVVFKNENVEWMKEMSQKDQAALKADMIKLGPMQRTATLDSLKIFFRQLHEARDYDSLYAAYNRRNEVAFGGPVLSSGKNDVTFYYGLRVMDYIYFMGWERVELAEQLLSPGLRQKYGTKAAQETYKLMAAHRRSALHDYQLPDTVISIPSDPLYTWQCSDNANYTWAYSDYDDFRVLRVHFVNLSLTDLTKTMDSVVRLLDSGMFFSVAACAGNYKYRVVRGMDYVLKKNKAEYRRIEYADPEVKRLMDGEGHEVFNLDKHPSNDFFFAPDGMHMACWDKGSQLLLFDVKGRRKVDLPNSFPAPTESFNPDGKSIMYYNTKTQQLYLSDLDGHILEQFPGRLTGIDSIDNIDFTGGGYLKVNNADTISLFDIKNRKMIMRFNKAFVDEIIVAPNGKDILLTCKTAYRSSEKTYSAALGIVTDDKLNIKARLYSGCNKYAYTPDGAFIVGYSSSAVMRWSTNITGSVASDALTKGCLSLEEMVKLNCLSLSRWPAVADADLIEKGARGFKDLGGDESNGLLKTLYYRQSRGLWNRLILGNARNIRSERLPFFYDWCNWVDNKMGHKDFGGQFVRQLAAVRIFDRYVNSADSVYPEQLYYAANGNMLLCNLYDSVGVFDNDVIEQAYKEITLRHRTFVRNPDNDDNVYYYTKAIARLSAVCDTMGWRHLLNGRYHERIPVYGEEVRVLGEKFKTLPDSIGVKKYYINALTQLGATFLYLHASHDKGYGSPLDSAIWYADKGLSLSPGKYDSARLLLVKARAWMLRPEGLENSMAIYRKVLYSYGSEITKESMLAQLKNMRDAGAPYTGNMTKVEAYLQEKK